MDNEKAVRTLLRDILFLDSETCLQPLWKASGMEILLHGLIPRALNPYEPCSPRSSRQGVR